MWSISHFLIPACFHLSPGSPCWCEAEVVTLGITPLSPEISCNFLDPRAKGLYVYLPFFRRPYHQGQRHHKLTLLIYSSMCYSLYSLTLHPSLLPNCLPRGLQDWVGDTETTAIQRLFKRHLQLCNVKSNKSLHIFLSISIYMRYISSTIRYMKGSVISLSCISLAYVSTFDTYPEMKQNISHLLDIYPVCI